MNTRELRIGNWVMLDKSITGDTKPIDACTIEEIGVGCIVVSGIDYYISNEIIKPIQLTPELLKSIGFNIKHQYHSTLYAENCIIVEVDGFELARRFESDNAFLFETSTHFAPIRYLHQLQNLYFAIAGEELDVKL